MCGIGLIFIVLVYVATMILFNFFDAFHVSVVDVICHGCESIYLVINCRNDIRKKIKIGIYSLGLRLS